MDKLMFPYRSETHLPMLHVVSESGSWEKYGLDVHYDQKISSSEAHKSVTSGEVEFVGGNHVTTYGRRARGDDWVYLGQTMNSVPGRKLVVRPDSGINSIADLKHKKVGTLGHHPGLNDWLDLKQHGLDEDRDDVLIAQQHSPDGQVGPAEGKLWQKVRDGEIDAAFIWPPATIFARRAGMKLIDLDPFPMIFYTTISTSLRFAEQHPDIVERFIKGLAEGIHVFKTRPEFAIKTIRERYTHEGQLDDEAATELHGAVAAALDERLYPSAHAIDNVYQEGIRMDKDALKISPMELWDLHFVRRLQDSGFFAELEGSAVGR